MEKNASSLLDFIKASPSPFHVVEQAAKELSAAGFEELSLGSPFRLRRGGRYFLRAYGSAFVAFRVGEAGPLRMAAAHTDSPCFRLKPSASMEKEGYGVLNVEPYGGLMLRTWLDRPLSLAGKVVLRRDDPFQPEVRLFDGEGPLITIPSLAIHMDREVNEKGALKVQENMLPLATLLGETEGEEKKDFFLSWLAEEIGAGEEDILSYAFRAFVLRRGRRESASLPASTMRKSAAAQSRGRREISSGGYSPVSTRPSAPRKHWSRPSPRASSSPWMWPTPRIRTMQARWIRSFIRCSGAAWP